MVLGVLDPDPAKQQALSQALALTLVVAGLLIAVLVGLGAYSVLRRRRERVVRARSEPTRRLDAWAVAGERVSYEKRGDEFEDDDDSDETDYDESTWYDDSDDESSWDEDDDEGDDLSTGGDDDPGPRPPRPPSGPLPPEDHRDDDSFNDDDIPGSRLDWKPKGP